MRKFSNGGGAAEGYILGILKSCKNAGEVINA